MTFKFLKIMGIGFILSVKKLLPILFLFTGFQANAVVIGNLTYDGTYISGDGRTYVGLDTIAAWDYATTLAATTEVDGPYEGFRIANTADADFFIGSLFGASNDNCSTVDGTMINTTHCGILNGWADGVFGNNGDNNDDYFMFIADETNGADAGLTMIRELTGEVVQYEGWAPMWFSDGYSQGGYNSPYHISWLLTKNTSVEVDEPSILALMALGIFGIGFARRRRQS
jgi:hypothetical protein